jgi:hypothetical protein
MMATKAQHQLGDISQDTPGICIVHSEEGDNWIGNWIFGFGFMNVKFPKATTRELTQEEKEKYHNTWVAVGSQFRYQLKTNMPENLEPKLRDKAITVTTRNSTYRFGPADENGKRTIAREGKSLKHTVCKIEYLAIGEELLAKWLDGSGLGLKTTTVQSVA